MAMNKLILVNGDIATGKSHFALILKEKFNLPLYTKDEFKERYADESVCSTYQESHLLSIKAMNTLIDIFLRNAPQNVNLILEANFHEEHLKRIEQIADEYHYQILNLDLVGTPEVLYQRYVNRRDHETRHPVHAINTLNDFASFKKYCEERKSEYKCGEVIEIDADDFSYQQNEELLNKIKQFLLN